MMFVTERQLLIEAQEQLHRIDNLIHSDSTPEELELAKTLAWRMWMRIEEKKNCPPY